MDFSVTAGKELQPAESWREVSQNDTRSPGKCLENIKKVKPTPQTKQTARLHTQSRQLTHQLSKILIEDHLKYVSQSCQESRGFDRQPGSDSSSIFFHPGRESLWLPFIFTLNLWTLWKEAELSHANVSVRLSSKAAPMMALFDAQLYGALGVSGMEFVPL